MVEQIGLTFEKKQGLFFSLRGAEYDVQSYGESSRISRFLGAHAVLQLASSPEQFNGEISLLCLVFFDKLSSLFLCTNLTFEKKQGLFFSLRGAEYDVQSYGESSRISRFLGAHAVLQLASSPEQFNGEISLLCLVFFDKLSSLFLCTNLTSGLVFACLLSSTNCRLFFSFALVF